MRAVCSARLEVGLLWLVFLCCPVVGWAQSDAEIALNKARGAYEAGEYDVARDQLRVASQTAPQNPDIFLLLGKAHYALGEVPEAMAAWRKTLKLAPQQAYAKQMVAKLQGQLTDVATSLRLANELVQSTLYSEARNELERIALANLPENQHVQLLQLKAQIQVAMGQLEQARRILQEIEVRYPQAAQTPQTRLLLGLALLETDPEPGMATLEGLINKHPKSPQAVIAELELILYRASHGSEQTEALQQWLAAHPQHPRARTARARLLRLLLSRPSQAKWTPVARRSAPTKAKAPARPALPRPTPMLDIELSEKDTAAIDVLAALVAGVPEDEALKLTEQLLTHWDRVYLGKRAYQAVISGDQALLAIQKPQPLPPSCRRAVLRQLYHAQSGQALVQFRLDVEAGRIDTPQEAAALPAAFAQALETLTTLKRAFAEEPTEAPRVELAEQILAASDSVAWPAVVTSPKPTHLWAMAVAQPVLNSPEQILSSRAITIFETVTNQIQGLPNQQAAPRLAVQVHQRLRDHLPEDHPGWAQVAFRQFELLAHLTTATFQEKLKQGGPGGRNQLTDDQQAALAVITEILKRRPADAAVALQKVRSWLTLWLTHDQDSLVEAAYTQLAQAMPPATGREVRLSLAKLWVDQVLDEHRRRLLQGFAVARELDPQLIRALKLCYQLQGDLPRDDEFVGRARSLSGQVIQHYQVLEYFDTAAAAMAVKEEPAVPGADAYAAFQLAQLKETLARRELARLVRQHNGREQVTLTPKFKEAMTAYRKFITDRPTDPLVSQAVERLFGIGRLFGQQQAETVAAEVYRNIEEFAKGVETLQPIEPSQASVAGRAAQAAADTLRAYAQRLLEKKLSEQPADAPPPAALSQEFTAALAAYQGIIKRYSNTSLVQSAFEAIGQIALTHARIGAWEVAGGVFADLLQQELPLRQPERIEFAKAMCLVGQVLPDHALQMLTTLASICTDTAEFPETEGEVSGFGSIAGTTDNAADPSGTRDRPGEGLPEVTTPPNDIGGRGPFGDWQKPGPDPEGSLDRFRSDHDQQLLAAIRTQNINQAARVAMLEDTLTRRRQPTFEPGLQPGGGGPANQPGPGPPAFNQPPSDQSRQAEQQGGQQALSQMPMQQAAPGPAVVEVLSEAEIQRRRKVLDAAYEALQAISKQYAQTTTAGQARAEILVVVDHWRTIRRWQDAARMTKRFLADNPEDPQVPQLRYRVARDYLAWAAEGLKSEGVEPARTKQQMLDEVLKRFAEAREELEGIVAAFVDQEGIRQKAQWDIATSYLTQARVVAAFSPTLARAQFVRAAEELLMVNREYHDHPQIESVAGIVWEIGQELIRRRYDDEAVTVLNQLIITWPTRPLADQAALTIAQLYQSQLQQPLRAVETYLELNFARGGDRNLQTTIFQIGSTLKNESRWVESLHVLETFVDSFPQHPQASQALILVGQIHQINEVWEDAIAAYRRVLDEQDDLHSEARWSIAESTINLSQWNEAITLYRDFLVDFQQQNNRSAQQGQDGRLAEARRRIGILKNLELYQEVVDEEGQRKAFDAQFQIGSIVATQLNNPVKAIIEYRKVAENYPQSHLADDALFEVGKIHLQRDNTEKAREALLAVAQKYPTSPLADDALFLVGNSYVKEANKLALVTRGSSEVIAKGIAQKQAYAIAQENRRLQRARGNLEVQKLLKAGKKDLAEGRVAFNKTQDLNFDLSNAMVVGQWAGQQAEVLSAAQLADRQDKTNAALRKAVKQYRQAAEVTAGDKADDALLQMAEIYDKRLDDDDAAMKVRLEIVQQFSGTAVAEDASWKIAEYYQQHQQYQKAVEAYSSFLRNYRRSQRAAAAQAAIAENYERMGSWVQAMDAYSNYINNFPSGPLVQKARDQIAWIKTYRL